MRWPLPLRRGRLPKRRNRRGSTAGLVVEHGGGRERDRAVLLHAVRARDVDEDPEQPGLEARALLEAVDALESPRARSLARLRRRPRGSGRTAARAERVTGDSDPTDTRTRRSRVPRAPSPRQRRRRSRARPRRIVRGDTTRRHSRAERRSLQLRRRPGRLVCNGSAARRTEGRPIDQLRR